MWEKVNLYKTYVVFPSRSVLWIYSIYRQSLNIIKSINMEIQSKMITVELTDGTFVRVEATSIGERKINLQTRPFEEVTRAIESLTKEIAETLHKVKPDRASVKFGIDVGIESGKLIVVLAKGSSGANLEITLGWGQ
jgi:hypothetical protein